MVSSSSVSIPTTMDQLRRLCGTPRHKDAILHQLEEDGDFDSGPGERHSGKGSRDSHLDLPSPTTTEEDDDEQEEGEDLGGSINESVSPPCCRRSSGLTDRRGTVRCAL